MVRKIIFGSIGVVIVVLAVAGYVIDRNRDRNPSVASTTSTPSSSKNDSQKTAEKSPDQTTAPPTIVGETVSPLGDPKTRVTKKFFGTYVTPQNSPVQPEKFTGYHTGWDFETTLSEANSDVVVSAFCAGTLKLKEWASGYGGVAVEGCTISGQAVTVVYGHLNIDTVTAKIGTSLTIGDRIGLLGMGFSHQTDGERKHLHFGIHKGDVVNIKGYVQNKADLSGWTDPTTYLGSL